MHKPASFGVFCRRSWRCLRILHVDTVHIALLGSVCLTDSLMVGTMDSLMVGLMVRLLIHLTVCLMASAMVTDIVRLMNCLMLAL